MQFLRLTASLGLSSAMAVGRLLLIFGTVFQVFLTTCSFAQEDCDQITRNGGLSALQAFLPSKIQIHDQCYELRYNETDICSSSCNTAIEDFLKNNGGEQGRIFFTCACAEDSAIYPLEECDIDRDRLLACPALFFLIPDEIATTTEPTDAISTTTKAAPSTKPIIPPGEDCRKARLKCQGGIACAQAFDYVKDTCLDDFTSDGAKCSKSCTEAVDTLDRYPTSTDLWGCACDPDSEEVTWCSMYGRNGLRKTCVEYKELDKEIEQSSEEDDSDPRGTACIRTVSTSLLTIIIPSVLALRLI